MSSDRVSARELDLLRARLSERDHAIIDAVNQHQFLTTRQIMRLHFHGHQSDPSGIRACTRVLGRLRDLRLLSRLDRMVGGFRAGSSSYVWCLDVLGDRLTRGDSAASRRRFFEPSLTFLGHRLAVAETRLMLEELSRTGSVRLTRLALEPHCWRRYLGRGGETIQLKPDMDIVLCARDYDDHWFIEVDQATESFPTLLEKCAQYEAYRRTGREQAAHGLFPRVLWIMPTERRAETLRQHIAATASLQARLFVVITPDQLTDTIRGPDLAADTNEAITSTAASQPIRKGGAT